MTTQPTVYGVEGCQGNGVQICHRCNRMACCDNLIKQRMTEDQLKKATSGLELHAYLDVDEWSFSSEDKEINGDLVHESLPWPCDWPEFMNVEDVKARGFIVD